MGVDRSPQLARGIRDVLFFCNDFLNIRKSIIKAEKGK